MKIFFSRLLQLFKKDIPFIVFILEFYTLIRLVAIVTVVCLILVGKFNDSNFIRYILNLF